MTSPLPDPWVAWLASRSLSIASVPLGRTAPARALRFEGARIPAVDESRSRTSFSPTSPSSSTSVRCVFLAFAAQEGSGFIRSYCRRSRVSYSRPESVVSAGASRSFRRRGAVRDTSGGSDASVQAAVFRDLSSEFATTGRGRDEEASDSRLFDSASDSCSSSASLFVPRSSSTETSGSGIITPSSTKNNF